MLIMARASLIFVALASLPVMGSCGVDSSAERRELEANRAKWKEHAVTAYELRLRDEACFCLHALGYGPFRVVVKQGKVIRAIYEGEMRDGYWPGRVISEETYEKTNLIATVEEVFARAERVLDSPDLVYTIRYDPKYGFPTLIDVDNPKMSDAQWRLVVDGFRPTKL
jgi:hypothetical protein